jgi:hypothetical protein
VVKLRELELVEVVGKEEANELLHTEALVGAAGHHQRFGVGYTVQPVELRVQQFVDFELPGHIDSGTSVEFVILLKCCMTGKCGVTEYNGVMEFTEI